jgi:hypothetical protein
MNKLLILLSSVLLVQVSLAVSLGDTLNQKIAVQTNTTNSTMKLINSDNKSSTFISTSTQGNMKFLVNNKTSKVYSISWHNNQAANFADILGNTYYPKFQTASKKPTIHVPLRGIMVDDGDLYVSQFGSMLSGFQGVATVSSLAP